MPNHWNYRMFFQDTTQFTPNFFQQILSLVRAHDYKLEYPVWSISLDGMEDTRYGNVEKLTDAMCSKGGHFPIWRDEEGININFEPLRRRMYLGVMHNLYQERDEEVTRDLETLFTAFCREFQPYYGYSGDEWLLEDALTPNFADNLNKFEHSYTTRDVPTLLFWRNYFEEGYFQQIGEWRFEKIKHQKVVEPGTGVFIYLAKYPWNANMAGLKDDGTYRLFFE